MRDSTRREVILTTFYEPIFPDRDIPRNIRNVICKYWVMNFVEIEGSFKEK